MVDTPSNNHRVTTSIALALALALVTIAAPAALASPSPKASRPSVRAVSGGGTGPARVAPTIVHVVHVYDQRGFDWGAAAIGAGGMLALTMIALGGTLVASSHSNRTSSHRYNSTAKGTQPRDAPHSSARSRSRSRARPCPLRRAQARAQLAP